MPSRAFASPRLVDYGPLPEPVEALFEAAVDAFERDVGLPVERIDPERIFRAGHVSDDWVVICATEHVQHLGREFCEANMDRFSAMFRGVVEFAREHPSRVTWPHVAAPSTTYGSSISSSATMPCC